jgi:peptidoglycan-associated lipoprotein
MHRRLMIVIALLLTLVASSCRSRVKPQAAPPPPPPAAEAPAVPPVETPVKPPSEDFPTPAVVEDDITSRDIGEANRIARERGWIRDAFFAFNSSALTDEARAALDASAKWLRENPRFTLLIEGHCDDRGTTQYNLALGDRRAWIARDYLVTAGVDPSRIRTVSYGEERPFEEGSSEEAWAQNRRAHLALTRTQ